MPVGRNNSFSLINLDKRSCCGILRTFGNIQPEPVGVQHTRHQTLLGLTRNSHQQLIDALAKAKVKATVAHFSPGRYHC